MGTIQIYLKGSTLILPRLSLPNAAAHYVGPFSSLRSAGLHHLEGNASLSHCHLKERSLTSSARYAYPNYMPTMGEVKIALSHFFLSRQQGMIISPIRGYFGAWKFPQALWALIGMDPHIKVWVSLKWAKTRTYIVLLAGQSSAGKLQI